jgi:hypothetical protein
MRPYGVKEDSEAADLVGRELDEEARVSEPSGLQVGRGRLLRSTVGPVGTSDPNSLRGRWQPEPRQSFLDERVWRMRTASIASLSRGGTSP